GVARHEHRARPAALHQLDAPEAPEPAHLADRGVGSRQTAYPISEIRARLGRVLHDTLLTECLDRRDRGRASEWMTRVGEPSGEVLAPYPLAKARPDDHRSERDVPGGDPLCDREDVRDDVPVVTREPASRAAEAGHDLVEDEQDSVAVADLADGLKVAVRRRDDSVRTGDRLEEHRRDRLRAFVLEDLLEMRRARADWTGIRMPGRAAIRVRVEHADDAGHPRLVRPATGIAGERDGAGR